MTVLIAQCSNGNTKENEEKFQTFSSEHKINQSQDGILEVNLIANINKINLGNKQAYVLNYNGQIPGPRLEAKPGDTIRVNFINKLPQPYELNCRKS
ncbi:MAG: multicopper oxidase domain-containing protein [Okeania sp. SIO3B3]|nr:multicopper oxidase domain-containing protein [Okeania sp. SIO3B3]